MTQHVTDEMVEKARQLMWEAIQDVVNAIAPDLIALGRAQGLEEAAKIVEGGSFLHNEAPTARLAKEAAAAIRRALISPREAQS